MPTSHGHRRPLSEAQIRGLRTFGNLWVQAGALGANLGRGQPGNQLDMTRYMRVFFGVPATEVPPNAELDRVTLVWDGERHPDRTLKFGENGMDKLNVPPAGERGRMFYRGKALLFSRRSDGAYDYAVGDERQAAEWERKSRTQGQQYAMPGGRKWGLFLER